MQYSITLVAGAYWIGGSLNIPENLWGKALLTRCTVGETAATSLGHVEKGCRMMGSAWRTIWTRDELHYPWNIRDLVKAGHNNWRRIRQ